MADPGPPTAEQIVGMSNELNLLAKQLYAVFTTPTNGLGPVMENIEAHLAFQNDLEKRGIMWGAGPFWNDDESTWDGEGMVVIRAGSLAEAKEIAASDPMHAAGARSFTVRPWLVNEGTLNIKLDFSGKTFEIT